MQRKGNCEKPMQRKACSVKLAFMLNLIVFSVTRRVLGENQICVYFSVHKKYENFLV